MLNYAVGVEPQMEAPSLQRPGAADKVLHTTNQVFMVRKRCQAMISGKIRLKN